MGFFNKVLAAEFDFSAIGQFFKNLYNGSFTGKLEELWDKLWDMVSMIHGFVPYILLALALVQLLFGKRLLGVQKFIGAFAIGYAASVVYLVPLIADLSAKLGEFGWIFGIVVGIIAILIRKVLYMVVYIAAFAYIPYYLVYSGSIVESFGGNYIYAGAAAAAVVILAILLRKWVEMLGLSALGAYCVVATVDVQLGLYDKIPRIPGLPEFAFGLILVGVLTLIGFIVQVKTRKRY